MGVLQAQDDLEKIHCMGGDDHRRALWKKRDTVRRGSMMAVDSGE